MSKPLPDCSDRELRALPAQWLLAERWDRAASLLCNLEFIEVKARRLGVNVLLSDYNEALHDKPSLNEQRSDLERMKMVIDLESHSLRSLQLTTNNFFAQQLHKRASQLGEKSLADKAAKRLEQIGEPYLELRWQAGRESLRLERTLGSNSDAVLSVMACSDGRRVVSMGADHTVRIWDINTGEELCSISYPSREQRPTPVVTADGSIAILPSSQVFVKIWSLGTGEDLRVVPVRAGKITAITMTPDDRYLIIASDYAIHLLNAETGEQIRSFHAHEADITTLTVSADSRWLISAAWDGTAKIWDIETGTLLATLSGHKKGGIRVTMTPNGRFVITGSSGDSTLKVWDAHTARPIHTLIGHENWSWIHSVAATSDSRFVISGGQDGTVRMWDLQSGRQVLTLTHNDDPVKSVVATPDGKHIIAGLLRGTLAVWDFERGWKSRVFGSHEAAVHAVIVSPDGRRLISASHDGSIVIWDLRTWKEEYRLTGYAGFQDFPVAAGLKGSYGLSTLEDNSPEVWNLDSHKPQSMSILAHRASVVTGIAVATNKRRAISMANDRTLRVWNLDTGKNEVSFVDCSSPMAITPDGRLAVTVFDQTSLCVWDIDAKRKLYKLSGHADTIIDVVITGHGSRLISSSKDGRLIAWDLATGERENSCMIPLEKGARVALAPDDKYVVVLAKENTIWIWNLETGILDQARNGDSGQAAQPFILIPEGHFLATGSENHEIGIWNLQTGQKEYALIGHTGMVNALALLPDNSRLVSASSDGSIRVWSLATKSAPKLTAGHSGAVRAVAITADGQLGISASDDHTLRIWDLRQGKLERVVSGHTASVYAVAITPNGDRMISASRDGTFRIWTIGTGQLDRILAENAKGLLGITVSPDGRHLISTSSGNDITTWDLHTALKGEGLVDYHRVDSSTTRDAIHDVVVTPDSRIAITARQDSFLSIFNLENGRIERLPRHSVEIHDLASIPDSSLVISASGDTTLKVWDVETGQQVCTMAGHEDSVETVAVTLDGLIAISGSRDKTVRVWDLYSGQVKHILRGHGGIVTAVAVMPGNAQMISGSDDGTIKVWNLHTGKEEKTLITHRRKKKMDWRTSRDGIMGLGVMPNSNLVVSLSGYQLEDGNFIVWDIEEGEEVARGKVGDIADLAVIPDGNSVLLAGMHLGMAPLPEREAIWAGGYAVLHKLSLDSGEIEWTIPTNQSKTDVITITDDGQHVICGSYDDRNIVILDLTTRQEEYTLGYEERGITAICVTADGQRMVAASGHFTQDGLLRVWDLRTRRAGHLLTSSGSRVRSLTLGDNGQRVLCASESSLVVWDLKGGYEEYMFADCGPFKDIHIALDGSRVLCISGKNALEVRDARDGKLLAGIVLDAELEAVTVGPGDVRTLVGDTMGSVYCLEYVQPSGGNRPG